MKHALFLSPFLSLSLLACVDTVTSETLEEPLPSPPPSYGSPSYPSYPPAQPTSSPSPSSSSAPIPSPAARVYFAGPAVVPGLEGIAAADATLDEDETTIVFTLKADGEPKLVRATRSNRNVPFGASVPFADVDDVPGAADIDFHYASTIFASNRKGTGFDLFVMTVGGGQALTNVNDEAADERHPHVAGAFGGSLLYFASNRTGEFALYSTTLNAGGPPTRLSTLDTTNDEDHPVVTRDGLRIYFASNRGSTQGKFDIWTAVRGSTVVSFGAPVSISELDGVDDDTPSFISRDGQRLYFTRVIAGTSRVYVATRLGSGT